MAIKKSGKMPLQEPGKQSEGIDTQKYGRQRGLDEEKFGKEGRQQGTHGTEDKYGEKKKGETFERGRPGYQPDKKEDPFKDKK